MLRPQAVHVQYQHTDGVIIYRIKVLSQGLDLFIKLFSIATPSPQLTHLISTAAAITVEHRDAPCTLQMYMMYILIYCIYRYKLLMLIHKHIRQILSHGYLFKYFSSQNGLCDIKSISSWKKYTYCFVWVSFVLHVPIKKPQWVRNYVIPSKNNINFTGQSTVCVSSTSWVLPYLLHGCNVVLNACVACIFVINLAGH